jgi:hypothetical protein
MGHDGAVHGAGDEAGEVRLGNEGDAENVASMGGAEAEGRTTGYAGKGRELDVAVVAHGSEPGTAR